jgi:hypothetical protein
MKASELQDLLITALVRKSGGSRRQWRMAIGPVRLHDRATHPHCNWSVAPSGSIAEISEIERLLDDVRLTHRFVIKG